ncbi:MAG TPA: iron chelate uptake ABC transporter family permease subunit, partial [Flavobacteriales bacterium]
MHRLRIGWLPILFLVVLILAALGLLCGSVPLSWSAVRAVLDGSSTDALARTIVREVRIPQVVTAASAGAGLAACGLIMQTLFRNPLAGPSV